MLLYYITDRMQFPGGERQRREALLAKVTEAARAGVDYLQLREKDLSSRDLETLARDAMERIRATGGKTRLLINSRTDVALAVRADGVHLRSKDVLPEDVRSIWHAAGEPGKPAVAVSCHSKADVLAAEQSGADWVVFGPVFGKNQTSGNATGLDLLRNVCQNTLPVFALGGITAQNAALCREAGAKGVAGIRLFQQGDIAEVVSKLRG